MQQVRDGTFQFYARTVYDYMTIGNSESYSTEGTYEYEAEKYGKTNY